MNEIKAIVRNDIPTKMLIETNGNSSVFLTKIYIASNDDVIFPETFKSANAVPIHKKVERTKEENDRPVSLFPIVLKLSERAMHNQMSYIDQ